MPVRVKQFNSITLFDDDDDLIARSYHMDVQYLGYPFDGLKGETGPFSVYKGGILNNDIVTWRFLDV